MKFSVQLLVSFKLEQNFYAHPLFVAVVCIFVSMRIVDSIPHPLMTISIFQMNDKFIVKFEAGPMEQLFKFRSDQVNGLQDLKNKISPQFQQDVLQRFHQMKEQLISVLSSDSPPTS
jgi:hypothetical protein